MADHKTDRIIFRLSESDADDFRTLTADKGGPSEVLRRFIRRYNKRHSQAA